MAIRTYQPFTKSDIIKSLQKLPEDATVDDAIEWLDTLREIEIGRAEIAAGDTFTQDEVEREMAEWQD